MKADANHKNTGLDLDVVPIESENTADAIGLWFAAAMLTAFLVAGAMIYRSGNSDFRIASTEAGPVVAQAGALGPGLVPPR